MPSELKLEHFFTVSGEICHFLATSFLKEKTGEVFRIVVAAERF